MKKIYWRSLFGKWKQVTKVEAKELVLQTMQGYGKRIKRNN